jgi:hypothetical protein
MVKNDIVLCTVEVVPLNQSNYFRKQGPVEAIPFYGAVLFSSTGNPEMRSEWLPVTVLNQVAIAPPLFAALANLKAYLHVAPGCRIRFSVVKVLGTLPANAVFEVVTG